MNTVKNVQLKKEVFILSSRNLVLTTCNERKIKDTDGYPTSTLTLGELSSPLLQNHRFAISLKLLTHSKSRFEDRHPLNPLLFFFTLIKKKVSPTLLPLRN